MTVALKCTGQERLERVAEIVRHDAHLVVAQTEEEARPGRCLSPRSLLRVDLREDRGAVPLRTLVRRDLIEDARRGGHGSGRRCAVGKTADKVKTVSPECEL